MEFEEAEKALDFLKNTDDEAAKIKASKEWLYEKKKTILAMSMAESTSKTQSGKEADAYASQSYQTWLLSYKDAIYDFETIRNKRLSAAIQIDIWRSYNANTRQGNI
jgi:formylmethanofuran dehydrogenase subunit E|tara:strand:+ start:672 stop:992 length:321 start_codon:yes stop_codon:yes gene_type:complete